MFFSREGDVSIGRGTAIGLDSFTASFARRIASASGPTTMLLLGGALIGAASLRRRIS
jgi:hypothetical protein